MTPSLRHYSTTTSPLLCGREDIGTFDFTYKPYVLIYRTMPETHELHARLLAQARDYDPTAHHRGLLEPYRDVLLLWRAKFMSYEQIAASLTQHGLKVSPAGVGVFCRRSFTKLEIERARQDLAAGERRPAGPTTGSGRPVTGTGQQRGPKVARDHY